MNTRRFERLERGQRESNERLGRIEDTLGHVAAILDAHSAHFTRLEGALLGVAEGVDRLVGRIDRLANAIARGRTRDLERFDDHERRLHALERRRPRRTR